MGASKGVSSNVVDSGMMKAGVLLVYRDPPNVPTLHRSTPRKRSQVEPRREDRMWDGHYRFERLSHHNAASLLR